MPRAAIIPVAPAPVIDPAIPEASPATNRFLTVVSIPELVLTFEERDLTSGAYNRVEPALMPGIIRSSLTKPSRILVTTRCGRAIEMSPGVTSLRLGKTIDLLILAQLL